MNRNFKCCKNKDFSNFICVACNSVFHPSCMERMTDIVKVSGFRILCSESCQNIFNEKDHMEDEKSEKIDALVKELKEKDTYIKRLKRNSQTFENDVTEAEKSFHVLLII